ncbi:MAG TPA: methyltransferase [Acidimicrobiales bacterium]|nr:methyltransferase [Acidimicrobiales bacterium]
MTAPAGPPPIARFWGLVNGFTGYFAVLAAEDVGVFTALADGPLEADQVAERCGADPARLLTVLGGNVAAGTLERGPDGFALTPVAATHLVAGRPGYLGALLRHSPGPFENWPHLADTVRGAAPRRDVGRESGEFLSELVQATFPVQLAVARAAVGSVLAGRLPSAPRVLELGAGAAPWSVAVLEHDGSAEAVVNDLPAVVPLARRALDDAGTADRATFLEGDYWQVPLPADRFDLAVLAHVCRAEGDGGAAALVGRAAAALAPGGLLVLAEYLLDDDLTGPTQAQMLGVTMVASTDRGGTFTHRQARAWLEGAGLVVEDEVTPVPPTNLVVARRPGAPAAGPGGTGGEHP